MSDLILAVPSKGRLEENAAAIFANAGVALKRAGARGYRGSVSGIGDIDVQYVSASEIAARLADGSVHMGITGEDLLREEIPDMDSVVQLVLPLGFGHADVVVAIPDGWVDVQNMADLAEVASEFRARNGKRLRVATKYTHLTADFFARHGLVDYRMVESFGATEAAPNAGAAEAIVDITSTGATLGANQLRVPQDGVILKAKPIWPLRSVPIGALPHVRQPKLCWRGSMQDGRRRIWCKCILSAAPMRISRLTLTPMRLFKPAIKRN